MLAAFAWLMVERLRAAEARERTSAARGPPASAVALRLAAWALLGSGVSAPSPWLAYSVAPRARRRHLCSDPIAMAGAGLVGRRGRSCCLILPPPLNRDQTLITILQRYSSKTSSFVLDALGVDHIMEGNTLLLPDKQFFVDEACSGIISVASIIACAVIYGVWRRRSALHTILLALAGVGWATLMNTLRISTIAVVHWSWSLDWTAGAPHQAISLCVFLFAFLALMSTDALLAGLLAPIGASMERKPWRSDPLGTAVRGGVRQAPGTQPSA